MTLARHFHIQKLMNHVGLRQAPPQRVLFQPDVSSTRQSRQPSNQITSPQPLTATTSTNYTNTPALNPNSSSFNMANYEPRQPVPLLLRNVITPANSPALFKEKIRRIRNVQLAKMGRAPLEEKPPMLPGSEFLDDLFRDGATNHENSGF